MHRTALSLILLVLPIGVYAGYDEFAILDFRSCKSYTLTSEWGDSEFDSAEAKLQFDRERAAAGIESGTPIYAMYGKRKVDEPPRFAGCDHKATSIECKRIGDFPYAVIKCPIGKPASKYWVRTCQIDGKSSAEVRMYSVDIGEHEDRSEVVINSFLTADWNRFNRQCNQKF